MANPGPANERSKPSEEAVRLQLAAILASATFARAKRQSAFLSYISGMTLDGRQREINEYSLAELYGRPASFDPATDPLVRVEARRLRLRLESYYSGEGKGAAVIISIPAGTYVPEFHVQSLIPLGSGSSEPPAESAAPPQLRRFSVPLVLAMGVFLAISALELWRLHYAPPVHAEIRETVQLTAFPGIERQPSLSPDRQRMAFSWDGENGDNFDIYIKSMAGNDIVRLTTDPASDQNPVWSPDGRYIAFLRRLSDLQQAVYVVPVNGGGERLVTTITTAVAGIAWTPNSRYLVVPDSPPKVLLGLFRVSVQTGERRQLTEYKGDFHPAFSPDGKTLAFVRMHNGRAASTVFLQRLTREFLADGEPESLDATADTPVPNTGPGKDSYPSAEIVHWPNWSSDGSTILFTRVTNKGPVAARLHLSGGNVEFLNELGANTDGVSEYSPKEYIYSRQRRHRFLAWARAGKKVETLPFKTSLEAAFPDLSPDGSKLAFISERNGPPALYLAGADGRNPRKIDLPGVTPDRPRWSPEGNQVVFVGWQNGWSRLYVVKSSGGQPEVLTVPGDSNKDDPSFSHDGKWIYYSDFQNGFSRIWRIAVSAPLSNAMPELITQDQGKFPEESRDGSKLYYGSRSTIRELDLHTHASKLLLEGVCEWAFRSTPLGIYALERGSTGDCSQVRFHPFSARSSAQFTLEVGNISGFSIAPGRPDMLTGFDRLEADIEAVTFR
jgi:Tol biopolymer transport system component